MKIMRDSAIFLAGLALALGGCSKREGMLASAIKKTKSAVIKKIFQTMLDNRVYEVRIDATGPDKLGNPLPKNTASDMSEYKSLDFTNVRESVMSAIGEDLKLALEGDLEIADEMIAINSSAAVSGKYIALDIKYSCDTVEPGYEKKDEYSWGLEMTGSMTVRWGEKALFSTSEVSTKTPAIFMYSEGDQRSLAAQILGETAYQFAKALLGR